MIQVAVDPGRGFTRKKLSPFVIKPHPDWEYLKNSNVNNFGKLCSTKWMAEVTINMGKEEKLELREHIKSYLTSNAGFNIVSCDRYSKEGHQGSKVLVTRGCTKGKKISGLMGTSCAISEEQERELALRGVDTSCILKSGRLDFT